MGRKYGLEELKHLLERKKERTGYLSLPLTKKRYPFKIKDYFYHRQSTSKDKYFVLDLIQFSDKRKEIRIGYYIIGKKGRMKGKWAWGQFCPLIPKKDLRELISKARRKKFI